MENNLSETAFVLPSTAGTCIRWFTPSCEVDLCGHATLAAAHALHLAGIFPGSELALRSRSGALTVRRVDSDVYELDFPSEAPSPAPDDSQLLTTLLSGGWGSDAVDTLRSRVLYLGRNRMDVLLQVPRDMMDSLRPDMSTLGRVSARGIIITAAGREGEGCAFVSRFFAPQSGVPEDPVTGSAHCALTPHWYAQLGMTAGVVHTFLAARQVSARGGDLHVALSDGGARTLIRGRATCVYISQLQPCAWYE